MKSIEPSRPCSAQKIISSNASLMQNHTLQITGGKPAQIDHRESLGNIQGLRRAGSDRRNPQDFMQRERRYHTSECSADTDPKEKKIVPDASTAVKTKTTAYQEGQYFKIPTQTARGHQDPDPFADDCIPRRFLNPLTRAPLQTPLIPKRHIVPTTQPYSLFPYPPHVTNPNPPSLLPFPNPLPLSPRRAYKKTS